MSFFEMEELPPDPIMSLPIAFAEDLRADKVNLSVGAYRTADGKPLLLTAVEKAEEKILRGGFNKEYLPIEGHSQYLESMLEIILGSDAVSSQLQRIFSAQTVGGSGALRVSAEFFRELLGDVTIFVSQPTWPNHLLLFKRAGVSVERYPYYDHKEHALDFSAMCAAIEKMPRRSVILLHGCCHNPTGIDPTWEQWQELSTLILQKGLIPLFDLAYQGFGHGLEEDARAVRFFFEQGHEMVIANSSSKSFGLYGERVGLVSFVAQDEERKRKLGSHIKSIIRGNYGSPPMHGAQIVSTILQSADLRKEWEDELEYMRERVEEMRAAFVAGLLARGSRVDFSFLKKQRGFFSFSGLREDQVLALRQKHGIYMPSSGRINVAGLNTQNMGYVIDAIVEVCAT